jgi:hypothetical protein
MRQMLNFYASRAMGGTSSATVPFLQSNLYGEADQFTKLEKEKVDVALTKLQENELTFHSDSCKRPYFISWLVMT